MECLASRKGHAVNKLMRQGAASRPQPTVDPYAQRLAAAEDIYNASQNPPATSYAGVQTPLMSANTVPADVKWTGAPIVSHKWRRKGLAYMWSWGGINMGQHQGPPKSGPDSGQVNSTQFQPTLVQLHDWQTNENWYICYPAASVMFGSQHNLGLSFRTPQLQTQVTGGSWNARMNPRNRYTKVQKVPAYNTSPRQYNTTSGGA
jgi:hypothetical protein